MTTKTKKLIIAAVAAVAVCAAVITAVCLTVFRGKNDNTHIQIEPPDDNVPAVVRGELDVSLVRNHLETRTINSRGSPEITSYPKKADFSDSSDNIFGLKSDTLIGPGCYFTADMEISNKKQGVFEYWLEIVPVGGDRLAADKLELAVTVGGQQVVKRALSGGLTTPVLQTVQNGEKSLFTVKLAVGDIDDNSLQGATLSFDVIAHAKLVI